MELKHVVIWGLLSFAVFSTFLVTAWICNAKKIKILQLLTPMQLFTVGVFIASVFIFIPYYYFIYDFGDFCKPLRPFFLSVHNALRMFVVDADFDPIAQMLPLERADGAATDAARAVVRILFSGYCAALYVVAPVLSFTNVLAYFKNIIGAVRYWMIVSKKLYIMSELNEKSMALAESIADKHRDEKENGDPTKPFAIVFTDVFSRNEEKNYELMERAMNLGAICLKKDIIHLDIVSKKGDVEVFLIGNDESENTSQAIRITKELNKMNKKQNVKVFAFCSKPGTEHIFNSLQYNNLLNYATEKGFAESTFKLRRVNEMQQLIWNTISKMNLFHLARKHNKTLSVLIVGFGRYGPEFFKALLWYCQFEGYTLEINIVDGRQKKANGICPVTAIIDRIGPEIMKLNRSKKEGEAQYDIEVFSGVDAQTYELDDLLYNGDGRCGIRERLKRTNLVFVALGDDDINIATAIHLRSVFDRINGFTAKKDTSENMEPVAIYSVVYDELKSGILKNRNEMKGETASDGNKQGTHKEEQSESKDVQQQERAEQNESIDGGQTVGSVGEEGVRHDTAAKLNKNGTSASTEEKTADPDLRQVDERQENRHAKTAEQTVLSQAIAEGMKNADHEDGASEQNQIAEEQKPKDENGADKNSHKDKTTLDDQQTVRLINHKGVPYNICFIGGMSSQFAYKNIYNYDLEQKAYRCHLEWVDHSETVKREWDEGKEKKPELIRKFKEDFDYCESIKRDPTEEKKKYEKFEYFRLSSIARQLYKDCIEGDEELKSEIVDAQTQPHQQTCECDKCLKRKRSEHRRWNAFLRTMGYSFDAETRDDRALLHPNLRPWDQLNELEKAKD